MSFNPKVAFFSGQTQNIDYTPGSAVAAGDVVVINGIAYFAQLPIAANALGSLVFSGGAWQGNKDTSVFAAGDEVYWIPTGTPVSGTASSGAFSNAFASGAIFAGYAVAAALTGDQFVYFVKTQGATSGLRFVAGQSTTATASDTIATGLSKVVGVVASLDSDPTDNPEWVSSSIGDQSAAPVAGSFLLKTWQNTSGSDPTPTAATTFSKKVNWIAFGY